MRRLVILLACLALAGCGGTEEAERGAIGEATIATNDPAAAADDIERPEEARPGVVVGEPSLEDLDELPRAGVGAGGATCAGTQLEPTPRNLRDVRAAILCLLNAERAARNLPPLHANPSLARAALLHSQEMVSRRYFSHVSANGEDFVSRIRKAGYLRGSRGWAVGENLAWGSGSYATPAEIVRGWMASPPHKANILNARFREIGIGIALGVPLPDAPGAGATYNTGFGTHL